ncbi:unnamed protein product [Blepharisma stoltei]|uniref:Uncharacterized protein n=1 Tax=Blepharisma stoltei TaxID=1481888 RepID=A0AAU9JDN9_9CILI|nr:unnamed protein product [Blepharisma stoltei]
MDWIPCSVPTSALRQWIFEFWEVNSDSFKQIVRDTATIGVSGNEEARLRVKALPIPRLAPMIRKQCDAIAIFMSELLNMVKNVDAILRWILKQLN